MLKRLFFVAAAMCVVMTAGCASVAGNSSPSTSSASRMSTDLADVAPRAASIPALKFALASSVVKGDAIKPGADLLAGSYVPAMTGKKIVSVQWVVDEVDGINRQMLALRLGPSGTKTLALLTKSAVGSHILVVLDGRVIDNVAIYQPLTEGQLTLDSSYVSTVRSAIDSATVPSKL